MCGIWRVKPRDPVSIDHLNCVFSDPYLSSRLTHINITGGEPLQHPDISGIASILNSFCPLLQEVSLNTSGLNPREIERIPEFRQVLKGSVFLNVTLSIDGIGALHNRIRGVKTAWSSVVHSLTRIQDFASTRKDLKPLINFTISRDNCNRQAILDIIQFSRQAKIDLSLTYGAVNDLYLRNNDSKMLRFTLEPEDRAALSVTLVELLDDAGFSGTQKHFFHMLIQMLRGQKRNTACVYQNYGVFLDLDGSVYPCGTAKHLSYGKLPEQSFEEIYAGANGDQIRSKLMSGVCPNCPSNSYYGLAKGVWLEVLRNSRGNNKTRKY
jgi:MoaA/NifB/PqqE/SkfB family radical SAM enzyme